jgi:hypothetical protein
MRWVRLWARFFWFAAGEYLGGRHPRYVNNRETLGREIFSSKQFYRSTRAINKNVFQAPRNRWDISCTRLSLFRRQMAVEIARRHGASHQKPRTFYGFAEIAVSAVREVEVEINGTPQFDNPFHADIELPRDDGPDLLLLIAVKLASRAKFSPA